jgi:hypothetical protein
VFKEPFSMQTQQLLQDSKKAGILSNLNNPINSNKFLSADNHLNGNNLFVHVILPFFSIFKLNINLI